MSLAIYEGVTAREAVAAWMFAYEFNRLDEAMSVEEMNRQWRKNVEVLNEPPWADGKHSGDCTKECHTCFRCLVEDIYKAADGILDALSACGYT